MSNILSDADEEIERTANEAAREVAAADAGEIAFAKSLADSWQREAERHDASKRWWRTAAFVEGLFIAGGIAAAGLLK